MTSFTAHVEGDPASVIAAGTWLEKTLATEVDAVVTALGEARRTAQSDWEGDDGRAFVERAGEARSHVQDLHGQLLDKGAGVVTLGRQLRGFQNEMESLRAEASGDGLRVTGNDVHYPSPIPPRPADIPAGTEMPLAEAEAHNARVTAWNAHVQLTESYDRLFEQAEDVRSRWRGAYRDLADRYRGQTPAQMVLTAGDIAGSVAGALRVYQSSFNRGSATYWQQKAARDLEWARKLDPAAVGREAFYRNLDDARNLADDSARALRAADDLERSGKTMPLKLGGALAVAGIGLEIANGKDPVQATVSGGLGFGASVAAGAMIGTAIPVPVVGTAVGAIVGAGVGIFTSGMVDNLFEGGSVGDAASAGWDAVTDTAGAIGGAVGDAAGAVGDTIGGWFD